jgi:hypothetical protein
MALFFSKMSSAVSTTDVGLYVVLNRDHLSILTEGPQADVLQAEASEAGSYDKN